MVDVSDPSLADGSLIRCVFFSSLLIFFFFPLNKKAYTDVRSDKSDTDWCLCGYTADGKALELRGKGSGGLAEMAQVLKNVISLLVFLKNHLRTLLTTNRCTDTSALLPEMRRASARSSCWSPGVDPK